MEEEGKSKFWSEMIFWTVCIMIACVIVIMIIPSLDNKSADHKGIECPSFVVKDISRDYSGRWSLTCENKNGDEIHIKTGYKTNIGDSLILCKIYDDNEK